MLRRRSVANQDYFENRIHQNICELLLQYFDKYKQLPTLPAMKEQLLTMKLDGEASQSEHISEMVNLYRIPVEDREYIIDKCVEFAKHQSIKVAILRSVDHLEKDDYGSISKEIEAALRVGEDVLDVGRFYVEQHDLAIDRRTTSRGVMSEYIPTMWKSLDRIMRGGLYRKQLGVIMAPPKAGKSATLVNLGATALQMGKKVYHYTLELATPFISERYDTRISGIRIGDLKTATEEIKSKLNIIQSRQGEVIIKEYPTKTASVKHIRSHVENIRTSKGYEPDLIIVDYGDLMKSVHDYRDNRYRELGSVYEDLRALAMELDIPVWTATQCNRAAASKPIITMEDIAESYEKIMVADVILTLCQTKEEKKKADLRIFVAGNRTGRSEIVIPCKFYPEQMMIREV